MTSPDKMSARHEAARRQSRATWNAVASGWYAQRESLWRASRPVSEWMVRKLDPQPGDTVLELAAGLGDTGLMMASLVGKTGCVIITDFAPEMVVAARRRVGAGFAEPAIEGIPFRWRFANQDAYWRFLTEAAGSFSQVLRTLSPETQETVW